MMRHMDTLDELDSRLYELSTELIDDVRTLKGDIMVLGAGGKMGPGLSRLAKLAVAAAGIRKRVIAVSRFGDDQTVQLLEDSGVEVIRVDLLDDPALHRLPEVENIIYMAGMKFGTTGHEHRTWAMNAYLPGRVAEKFQESRIVAFSTGNVYPFTPVDSGGPTESHSTNPVGEYAQSCLGRERIFEHFSLLNKTPVLIFRLNYAIDFRYGVLLELAKSVRARKPVDLAMGFVNVIWQGDANQIAIRCLHKASSPATILNVTGTQTLSVRQIATEFGHHFGVEPNFVGEERTTALLSNASEMAKLFPFKMVSIEEMIDMTVQWIEAGGPELNKPTHFQERFGKF